MSQYDPQRIPSAQEIAHAEYALELMKLTRAMTPPSQFPGVANGSPMIGNILRPPKGQTSSKDRA